MDMDAFFASVEQRDHEEYRGKPVIVGGLSKRGVVSTASYEARKFGVHSAMPMAIAKRKCPDGIFLEGNYRQYARVSSQIFEILDRFSPLVEPLSIDEGFLDITGMERLMKDPIEYGKRLKAAIRQETSLIASVGIAPNKFLAKLASDLEKPDGLTIIRMKDIPRILWPLPVSRLWGVGKKTEERLSLFGYRKIGELAQAKEDTLKKQVGEHLATHLIALANGRDNRPVEPIHEAKSIGKEMTFEEDIYSREDVKMYLLSLSAQVGWRLRREGKRARTIQVKIRLGDFSTYTRQKTLEDSVCYDEDIYRTALELFQSFSLSKGSGIRLLGISGSGFDVPSEMSLFGMELDRKKEKLYHAIDSLKGKFGEGIVGHLGESKRK